MYRVEVQTDLGWELFNEYNSYQNAMMNYQTIEIWGDVGVRLLEVVGGLNILLENYPSYLSAPRAHDSEECVAPGDWISYGF